MLTRRGVLAGGFGAMALTQPAWGASPVRIPIDVTDAGLPIVDTVISGRRLRFIVDTGAEVSAIRHDLALSLGLERLGHRSGIGADGRLRLIDYQAQGAVFGGVLRMPRLSLSAIPRPGAYDGLLGASFLTRAPSELDYGAREIRIHAARADFGDDTKVGVGHGSSPRIYCPFSVAGLPMSGMLDTGFETEVFLNAGFVERHGLWNRFPVREEKVFTGAAGKRLVTRVVDMPDFALGSISRQSIRVTLANPASGSIPAIGPQQAILGASLLRRYAIAFNGAGGLGFRAV